MDLSFSKKEIEFQQEVREWLKANIPKKRLPSLDSREGFEEHRQWERELHKAGWSVPNWPAEFGGRDCSIFEWLLFEEEYWASGAPGRVNTNGISLLAPTLFAFGTTEQKERFLPKMASGEEIWAQAWSEPNAGSDLASLNTKGVLDGEYFILNGQKTWCSRGAFADWLFCIVRSDPESERHHGLTYLLVPADTEGMERREVGRLDGQPAFAEIFFTDAKVHISNLLGEIGQGWSVAMSTTSSERGLNLRAPGRFMAAVGNLVKLQKELGDTKYLSKIAELWADSHAYRWICYSAASKLLAGQELGSDTSMMKVFWSDLDLKIAGLALEMLGERAEFMEGSPDAYDDGSWMDAYLFALAGPIYAGTNEIQRNIIAERVLGLPRK